MLVTQDTRFCPHAIRCKTLHNEQHCSGDFSEDGGMRHPHCDDHSRGAAIPADTHCFANGSK